METRNTSLGIANAAVAVARANRHARAAAAAAASDSDLLTPEQAARAKEEEADAHIRAQDFDEALQCLDKAIFLQPTRTMLYAKRAQVYWELCDLKSAMASYRKLFSLDSSPPQRVRDQFAALLNLHGYSLLVSHEAPAIATAYLSEAIELNGLEESYWLHRALAHIHAGCFEKALKDVDHCICLNRSDVEYFVLRAKLHWRLHMHDRATSDIQQAAKLAPDHPEVIEHEQRLLRESQAIYEQARTHVMLQQFADAIACLNKAAAISPDDTRFYLLRAAAYRELGEYHVALKDTERALGLHRRNMALEATKRQQESPSGALPPRSIAAEDDRSPEYREIASQRNLILLDIARRFLRDKAYQLALNALNQVIRGETELAERFHESFENPEQLVHRGDAYRGLENFQAALADYHRALELLPDSTEIRSRVALVHYHFGVQLFNKAQFDRAEVEFAHAIAQDGAVALYYVRRGDAARYLEKYEAACIDYQRALQLEPHDQETKNKLLQYSVKPRSLVSTTTVLQPATRGLSNQQTSELARSPTVSPPSSSVRRAQPFQTDEVQSPVRRSSAAATDSMTRRLEEARNASKKSSRVVQELFLNRPVMAKKPQ